MQRICDVVDKLKIGMLVETNGDGKVANGEGALTPYGLIIRGHIVAINGDRIYVGTNSVDGVCSGCGYYLKEAAKYGYKKTWAVYRNNCDAWIKILEDKSENIDTFIKPTEEAKMSLLYKFKQLFTNEPTKSLKKAGIIDDTGILTSEGRLVLLEWLLDKNIDAFKADVVDPIVKEMEREQ